MTTKTLTLIQEIYFDLCDILESNDYSGIKIKGCLYEFDDLQEFLTEQRAKLAEIETRLDLEKDGV